MGKNKNRTDLLAAGREKLQQFRTKKGKSSSQKTTKSEHEGDADVEPSHMDPPASPKVVEETALPVKDGAESSQSLAEHSVENPVSVDVLGPCETIPVQEVGLDPLALVKEEGAEGDVQNGGDSVEEVQDSSIGPSDMSVVVRGEPTHPAELATTPRDSLDEEKGSFLQQEFIHDVSVNEQKEDQEADSLGSNRCDGMDKESGGSFQVGGSLVVEHIRLESEGDLESDVSGNRETGKAFAGKSDDLDRTENLSDEAEEIKRYSVPSIISDDKVEGSRDHDAVSILAEATDEAEGKTYSKPAEGTDGANYRTEEGNAVDSRRVYVAENCNAGVSVSPEAVSSEETILDMGPEGTDKTEGTSVATHDTGGGSGVAMTNHEIVGTPDTDGEQKSEFQLEGVGVNSSNENEIEITSSSNDIGAEYKAGIQAVMEQDRLVDELHIQQRSSQEAFLVSNMQENPLEANVVLHGSHKETGSIDLNRLAKVIQGLDEDEIKHLLNLSFNPGTENMDMLEKGLGDSVESLKQQLYFTIVAKESLYLQLSEQIQLQMDFDQRDSQLRNDVSKLNSILRETQDCNTSLSEELAQCKSDLQAMAAGRDDLETQYIGASEELTKCRSDLQVIAAGREELETQWTGAREELAQCRSDLQAMAAGREKLEIHYTGAREELAQCRSDILSLAAGREELEMQFTATRKELAQCKFDLQAMLAEKEELEKQLATVRKEFGDITTGSFELQTQLESSHEQIANLLADLAGFRGSMEALETEKSNLHENLTAVMGEKEKLEKENRYLVRENERFAAQVLEHQEHDSKENEKHAQLEVYLQEAMVHLEQVTQENIILSGSLDIHKAKLSEMEGQHSQLLSQATEARCQLEGRDTPEMHCDPTDEEYLHQSPPEVVQKVASGAGESMVLHLAECNPLQPPEGENFVEFIGFSDMKAYSDEAEKIMNKLEKVIEGMHSHSVSLGRSAGKVAGAGVSKLIQAFELKVQDEYGPVELPLDDGDRLTEDHFTLATEQMNHLRAILKKVDLGAFKVGEELKEEKSNCKHASVALSELQILYEASKQHNETFEARVAELVKKLSDYQSRIDDMHLQLYTMQQKSDEMETLFPNQLENLQKDADYKLSILEQEWNFTIAEVYETVKNLDACIGRLHNTASYSTLQSADGNLGSHIAASVNAATKVIEDLHEKLGAAYTGLTKMHSSYESLNEKFSDLHVRNGVAVEILGMIYSELKKFIVSSCEEFQECGMVGNEETLLDILHPSNYSYLLDQLSELLGERLLLKSAKAELEAELVNTKQDVAEQRKHSIDVTAILKLVEDVKSVVKLDDLDIDSDKPSVTHLETLIAFLVQKYREATEKLSYSQDEFELKVMECSELQVRMNQLSSLSSQQEDETHILRKRLAEVDSTLATLQSELRAKGAELEQSEQRVSSVREKLSIAVGKGKGLIVQRDNLKQSLSEMSLELERCSQEVQLKDTRLREVEKKLKAYSEAGERMEALESELSYIRNSSTALRETFLLKDSVLQRIEEVLEELELPEHFYSRDTIGKIEWLVRSVSGNSMPMTDWDKKSFVAGGSYSDAGFVVMDGWKQDTHAISNPGLESLKMQNEELQNKFYGLAEQNEMLEQSLMDRNILVHRWEEVLGLIDMPSQLRSLDTVERIEWLGSALSEAHRDRDFLREEIENFESRCGSLTAELDQSQMKISDLELALQGVTRERELLSESLESLSFNQEKVLQKETEYELERCNLQKEVTSLQEKVVKMLENDDHYHHVKDEIKRLQVLVSDALQYQSADDIVHGGSDTECLEELLRNLVENYKALSFEKSVLKDAVEGSHARESLVAHDGRNDVALKSSEQDKVILEQELEEAFSKLSYEKTEREKILENYQSLVVDFDELGRQRDELQEKLNQEEMKLVSTRDKLNVAVRKGKGLVQQRDSLKQTIEEMKTDIDHLKTELNQKENTHMQYQQKIKDLSAYPEKAETAERECVFLRSRLIETEQSLQDTGRALSSMMNSLNAIDIGGGMNTVDPLMKIEKIGKLWHDLQRALTSSEHESKKSKRATELLLAELNEVHERADNLQEDLSKVETALDIISRERDLAEAARNEALSRLENVATVHLEERKKELAEVTKFKAVIGQLRKGCFGFGNLLTDFFSVELELLRSVEVGMESLLKQVDRSDVPNLPDSVAPGGMVLANSASEVKFRASNTLAEMKIAENLDDCSITDVFAIVGRSLQECSGEFDALKEKCYKHTISCDQQAKRVSKAMEAVHKKISSRKELLESERKDFAHFEVTRKEKEMEIFMMRKMIALLYKACTSSILEIENQKGQVRDGLYVHGKGMDLKLPTSIDGQPSFSEVSINSIADTLLLTVKESVNVQAELVNNSLKELKTTISTLQKELQENDIQKNRICTELVSQIKKAEGDAKTCLVDLQSANIQVENLEKRIETLEKERGDLELRIKELQDGETSSMQLQEKIVRLTDLLSAKGQEIEDLMQALDEEEVQMEGLRSKIEQLEKISQQKNLTLENLEASRSKAMSRLSTTVSKFDELHQLSESLLSEVENLQSQLQGRDAEISFLRQEVTRCTNDVLAASKESNKRNSSEMNDLLTWLDMMISHVGGYVRDVKFDATGYDRMEACKENLGKQIASLLSELEALSVMVHNKDALLQVEKNRTEELAQKVDSLEKFLREKELNIASFQGSRDLGETTSIASSEITEVEATINKRLVAGASVTPHVRSMRKVNNDQVAISIDTDPGGGRLDDEDDKVHGFKSLTTSRVVPRFTRPVSDMIDGLWVSCDRALMRQPALRLGIILYWVMLHTLLATSLI